MSAQDAATVKVCTSLILEVVGAVANSAGDAIASTSMAAAAIVVTLDLPDDLFELWVESIRSGRAGIRAKDAAANPQTGGAP